MHPASLASKAQMKAEVVLASSTAHSPQITTIHMRVPRIIWAEIMTHRVFSRNARSSRAVPVKRMLAEIRETPFVPWHWGKNQSGMQADEENSTLVNWFMDETGMKSNREHAWQLAAMQACDWAESFANAGYHKQVVNRITEPYSFIDALVTSTSWQNFLHLRDHPDAEPHFRDLAKMVRTALDDSEARTLSPGDWHLPYITEEDWDWAFAQPGPRDAAIDILKKISAARCARISYAPFDGDARWERELERYDMLVGSSAVHASPLEHQATPDTFFRRSGTIVPQYSNPTYHGNLAGWIQYRKRVPGEAVPG